MLDKTMLEQNVMAALGLINLPEERKVALIEKMTELVEKNLIVRILQGLTDEDAQEFEKIINGTEEEKVKFIQAKFPNFAEMMQEEIVKVKQAVIEAGKVEI